MALQILSNGSEFVAIDYADRRASAAIAAIPQNFRSIILDRSLFDPDEDDKDRDENDFAYTAEWKVVAMEGWSREQEQERGPLAISTKPFNEKPAYSVFGEFDNFEEGKYGFVVFPGSVAAGFDDSYGTFYGTDIPPDLQIDLEVQARALFADQIQRSREPRLARCGVHLGNAIASAGNAQCAVNPNEVIPSEAVVPHCLPHPPNKLQQHRRCLERYHAITCGAKGIGSRAVHQIGQPISQFTNSGFNFRLCEGRAQPGVPHQHILPAGIPGARGEDSQTAA